MDLTKPYPAPIPDTQLFWQGLRDERIMLQRCDDCFTWIYYPRANCPSCLSSNLTWHQVSGEGTLYTFTVTRQATAPHFQDEVPQMIAMIDLDEGVRLTSTLVTDEAEKPVIGARVVPVFDHINEDVTLLRYRLA